MLIQLIIVMLLILVNGVFAASEIAFLSVNKFELKQEVKKKNKKAIKIQKLVDNPSGFLATIQIGITLAGFLASAFAAEAFADELVEYFKFLSISVNILKPIIVILVTLILSYFTLVLGELVPKRMAMSFPEKIAYNVVNMITVLMKVTYPFVWLLTKSTNIVAKIFGISKNAEEKVTEEEIKAMISTGTDDGTIEEGEKNLIFNVFSFNDVEASKIMTKKENVVSVDVNISNQGLMEKIKNHKYTRMPVYNKEKDNIIGVLNIKDIIVYHKKTKKMEILDIMHEALFVEDTDKADDIFKLMQKRRQGMVIVKDKEENFVGIITMEDVIEESVGNIFDEFDEIKNNL